MYMYMYICIYGYIFETASIQPIHHPYPYHVLLLLLSSIKFSINFSINLELGGRTGQDGAGQDRSRRSLCTVPTSGTWVGYGRGG